MAKILIVASANSPLTRARGVVGQVDGHEIAWVSTPKIQIDNVRAFGPENEGRLQSTLIEPFHLWNALTTFKPDLIHVHFARQSLRTPLLCLTQQPMIVSTMGGDILPDQGYRGLHATGVRALLNRADCITSKSAFMEQAIKKIGSYDHKLERVTWGIDLDHYHAGRDVDYLRAQWQIPDDRLVFFDVRGAKPLYNKHIILDAFARYIQEKGPNAVLLISEFAADRTYLEELHQQVESLELASHVRFVGSIEHEKMADYHALADVVISIPRSDGLPQSIYESLACGAYLVLGDLPQYEGVVEEGVTASLTPIGDADAVAQALLEVATDANRLEIARQVGRAVVTKEANQRVESDRVNKIYRRLLQDKRKSI